MRKLTTIFLAAVFPVVCGGFVHAETKAAGATKEITVKADASGGLKMSVPKEAEVKTEGNETTIRTARLRIILWSLPEEKSVADAVSHVAAIIKPEFIKYAVESTEAIQVAGHEGKHLKGKGEEADDNDPGTADVVVFTDGKHVYAACVHGEGEEAIKERPAFLTVLKSAQGE